MKNTSAALNTHLQLEVTTLATCWRLTRIDGVKFHFTEHNEDLLFDLDGSGTSDTYKASSSYNRSAIKNDDTLAVDNLDLTGVLDANDVDEVDLRRGLFDYASVEIFFVNWDDLAQGALKIRKGRLGEVTITANGLFFAELRGLTQAYSRRIGELYTPECRVDLGDSRCKIPILPEVAVRNKAYVVGDFVRASSALETVSVPVLLVHLDVTALDEVLSITGTLGSQAAIQTVQKKFGVGSVEFTPSGSVDPSASFISFPDDSTYTIAAGEFTVEGEARFKDLTSTIQVLVSHWNEDGSQRSWLVQRNGNNLEFSYSVDGTAVVTITGAFTFVIDTFYEFAVTRDVNDDIRLFVNGTQVGATTAAAATFHDSTALLLLGKKRGVTDDLPMDGFLDEVRITVGKAVYTANFTQPTAAHQLISEAVAALVCADFDDRIYVVTTAGQSDAFLQPAYDTIVGNTTTDGTAIFTAEEAWSRCIEVSAVDEADPRKIFTVTELTPSTGPGTDGRDQFPTDSMNGGVVVWESGANAGISMEMRDFTQSGATQVIELFLDLPFDISVTDKGRVYRGCNKRLIEDCRDIFDNTVNFRGEPYVPGQDALFSYPDAKA